ncbi:MAG: hypothetical protein MUE41_06745 [Gemmatimonadaceae bacterium]|nr:hypothetical protein [Gemmatimonadaceae bacterium]
MIVRHDPTGVMAETGVLLLGLDAVVEVYNDVGLRPENPLRVRDASRDTWTWRLAVTRSADRSPGPIALTTHLSSALEARGAHRDAEPVLAWVLRHVVAEPVAALRARWTRVLQAFDAAAVTSLTQLGLTEGAANQLLEACRKLEDGVDVVEELLARIGPPWSDWDAARIAEYDHDGIGLTPLSHLSGFLNGALFVEMMRTPLRLTPPDRKLFEAWAGATGEMHYGIDEARLRLADASTLVAEWDACLDGDRPGTEDAGVPTE